MNAGHVAGISSPVTGLLLGAARQYGAALVIATHDGRLKSRILRHLALPATGAGGRG